MELREALCQISEIRHQMARGEMFRGYRSLTVGFSGVLAILASVVQPYLVGSPSQDLNRYLLMWTCVAAACVAAAGSEMWWRASPTPRWRDE